MKNKIDTSKLTFAHLASLTPDDFEANKSNNINLRCTHGDWVVGNVGEDNNGTPVFFDVLDDEKNMYLYFKCVSDAQEFLMDVDEKPEFVVRANPLKDIGITGKLTKGKLKTILSKSGLHFTFMDEEIEQIKKQPAIRKK